MDEIGNPSERVHGHAVTPSLLRALRVQPAIGRLFRDEEAGIDDAAPIIILSHSLWRYGADAGILNKQIRVNGRSLTVVGVMPEGFWYPVSTGGSGTIGKRLGRARRQRSIAFVGG